MSNKTAISLSEALENGGKPITENPPIWLNAPINCFVAEPSMKDGKWRARLIDPLDENIHCTGWFGARDPQIYVGMAIIISGKGNVLKEYNGKKSIAIGRNGEISFANPNQPKRDFGKQLEKPSEVPPAKVADAVANNPVVPAVFGATAGMATKGAIDLAIARAETSNQDLESLLWKYGSLIVRVAQRLERGDLHSPTTPNDVPF